ncbi:hypothetical protein V6N13_073333 [Hibiscus sabdariffa]
MPQWFFARHRSAAIHRNKRSNEKQNAKISKNQKVETKSRSSPFPIKPEHQTSTKLATFSQRAAYSTGPGQTRRSKSESRKKTLKKYRKRSKLEKWFPGEQDFLRRRNSCLAEEGGGFPAKVTENQ